jgi:hypothetical protein
MTRPCGHAGSVEGCRWCHLLSDPGPTGRHYRAVAEALAVGAPPPDAARVLRPCRYRGAETGETRPCDTCRGTVRVKLQACSVHKACTSLKALPGLACCQTCGDYDPFEPFAGPPVRDLAYHVYPARSGSHAWRWNVRQLLRRISLFNGRRVVAVSVDGKTESVGEVMDAFGGEVDAADFVVVENEPGAPEAKTLPLLLARLRTDDPDRCLLRAHAKGVTHEHDGKWPVVKEWVETLYEAMLDYWQVVQDMLAHHPVTGCFRCDWQQWPQEAPASRWFYSGSWFWARSRHLFARPWRDVPRFWSGVEALPSLLFDREEAGCLFADSCGVVYNADTWKQLRPAFDRWAAGNAHGWTVGESGRPGGGVLAEHLPGRPREVPPWQRRNHTTPAAPLCQVVSVVTADYVPRARPFLRSLALLHDVKRWCVCLGFPPGLLADAYPHIHFVEMSRHWSESNGMLQTGRWLDVLPEVRDEDVVLLSDADVLVQRDLSAAERALLAELPGNAFTAAWNAYEGDNLAEEARRIGLGDPGFYGGQEALRAIPCFNAGVLAMRAGCWRRLCEEYEGCCRAFYARSSHRSRIQWLVCWCLHRLGLRHVLLDAAFHSTGHFGTPPGVTLAGGAALAGTTPVLFRHALGG